MKRKEYTVQEVICNPIYTGMGRFPGVISDSQWIKANKNTIEIEGPPWKRGVDYGYVTTTQHLWVLTS
ncbi:MAG TPA: hypothetical protein ENI51_11365, partial [Candidatus Atribacteria bacterium]|nr:hypothetical protein [Candidatus Atribacteria bacterium]